MNYFEITSLLEAARGEKKRHYDEWCARQKSFLNSSPEWQEMEAARSQYELAKVRFENLNTQYHIDNPPLAYERSRDTVTELERKWENFQQEVRRVCHAYRDLILDEDEDGVLLNGDPIVGDPDWLWSCYSVTEVNTDGFVLYDDACDYDHPNDHIRIPITWEQYQNIAMYVALHRQPGDKR